MQKHKKWLVITIWVSTIAFVGAGFVGWGSYNFGRKSSTVMIVGDEEVKLNEVQKEYSRLYNDYANQYAQFGINFTKEMAQKLHLDKTAIKSIKQKYFLLTLAKSYGLSATPQEIAKIVVQNKAFYKNNKFDKNTYIKVLKQNRSSVAEYEQDIANSIILQKLFKIYKIPTLPTELDNIKKILFSQDKLAINIINSDDIKVKTNEAKLKQYYDKNKQNYKSNTTYICNIESLKITDEKKSKKEALKLYLSLKKGKKSFTKQIKIDGLNNDFDPTNFNKIKTAPLNKVLKPIKLNDKYVILQLIQVKKPATLPYKDVANKVKQDYIANERMQIANMLRDNILKNFEGRDIGYLNKEKPTKISGLEQNEIIQLINSASISTKKINFVNVGNKIIVYKILDTKYSNPSNPKLEVSINDRLNNIKSNEIISNLIKKLSNKIEVIDYWK
jgi:peptidyl-prolyl cis-trans isomerase D